MHFNPPDIRELIEAILVIHANTYGFLYDKDIEISQTGDIINLTLILWKNGLEPGMIMRAEFT